MKYMAKRSPYLQRYWKKTSPLSSWDVSRLHLKRINVEANISHGRGTTTNFRMGSFTHNWPHCIFRGGNFLKWRTKNVASPLCTDDPCFITVKVIMKPFQKTYFKESSACDPFSLSIQSALARRIWGAPTSLSQQRPSHPASHYGRHIGQLCSHCRQ
jgi:hypothetical protein